MCFTRSARADWRAGKNNSLTIAILRELSKQVHVALQSQLAINRLLLGTHRLRAAIPQLGNGRRARVGQVHQYSKLRMLDFQITDEVKTFSALEPILHY